jgi:hypothetical protein
MTAVEWLMEQITYDNGFGERRNSYTDSFDLKEFFEKAKEMEKQQIIDAWTDAKYCNTIGNEINYEDGEQYYNETFNKNE